MTTPHITASATLTANLAMAGVAGVADDGLWQTYDGLPMTMDLFGDGPVLALVELDSLTIPERPPALAGHEDDQPVGWWTEHRVITAADGGQALAQRLHLLTPPEPDDYASWTEHHQRAAAHRGLLRGGFPLQASIHTEPNPGKGAWQRLTAPATVNGRAIDPEASPLPVWVLRGGLLRESSLVILGQSTHTGQLAARLCAALSAAATPPPSAAQPPKESTMDLKERKAALLELHGDDYAPLILDLLVEGAEDEAIGEAIAAAIATAEAAKIEAELTAAKAEAEEHKTEAEAAKASLAEVKAQLEKTTGELQALRDSRRQPPTTPATASASASLRRGTMTPSQRLDYVNAHGAEALAALPY